MLEFHFKKLKNNLNLFVIKTRKLSSLDITLYIKTGSAYENKNNNGISHLLEHLLFLKTKQLKLNPIAFDIYPYTQKDFTYFEITTHKDLLNVGLSTLFSIVTSPDFTEKNFGIVKDIAKEELREFYEDSHDVLNQKIDYFLYKNNNLSLSIGGDEKNIERITINNLKKWYNGYYYPDNMILTLVGNININRTIKQINDILKINNLPNNFNNKNKFKNDDRIIYPTTKSRIIKLKNNINFQQTHLAFVFPTSGVNHPNYIDFVLLAEILNKKIRQEFENSGLLYDIQLYYHSYLNAGEFRIITACQKKNVNIIFKKFDSFIKNNEISISSFKKIKEYLKYQFLLKEDRMDELSSLSLYLLNNKSGLVTLDNEIKKVENIKFNEINKIKRKYFNKKNAYYFIME